MNALPQSIEAEIILLIERCASVAVPKSMNASTKLGLEALALDSLALLQLILAVENRFGIEIPPAQWADFPQLTIGQLANRVRTDKATSGTPDGADWVFPERRAAPVTRTTMDRAVRFGARRIRGVKNRIYSGFSEFILDFDLVHTQLPKFRASIGLEIREVSADDRTGLAGLWKPKDRAEKIGVFERRLNGPFTGWVALHEGRIVGLDWIAHHGDYEPDMDLTVRTRAGTCYGIDLNEHPEMGGKGVGLELLCWGLHASARAGFRRQVTFVRSDNHKMLGAALHLLGFQKLGRIDTRVLAGRPSSRWEIDGRSGSGTLEL